MATIDRTPNGGTAGHPANVARPYVMTSKVHDTADGGAGGDVIQLIDVPADTMIVAGVLEVLEIEPNICFSLSRLCAICASTICFGSLKGFPCPG